MEEKPSYFAIITADVRYDNNLCANEKLMFGEITALLQKTGICWASNRYFAELFNVSKETVSRWINHLFELHYICVQVIRDVSTNQIIERTITLPTVHYEESIPIDKNINTPIDKKINTPIEKNVKENNINNINNTSKNNIIKNNIIKNNTSNIIKEYNKLKEEYPKKEYKERKIISEFVFNEETVNSINLWLKYKEEKRQGYKETGFRTLLKKLNDWEKEFGSKYVVDAINNSICQNYNGIFPVKTQNITYQPKRDNTMDILKDLYQKYSEEEVQ